MAILDDIATERQRLTERLVRLNAERGRLAEQITELEAAERVMSRLGPGPAGSPRGRRATGKGGPDAVARGRGRQSRASSAATPSRPARTPRQRRTRGGAVAKPDVSLGDAALRAVAALGNHVSAERIRIYLVEEFGMQLRPNHLGMALQRHRRAGRLEQSGGDWSMPQLQVDEPATAR